MVKWRDVWTFELDDIFKRCGIGLNQRLMLLPKIQNSQMMDEVEVKQEVIDKWEKMHNWRRPLDCPQCKGKKTFQEGKCSECGYDVAL